MPDEIATCNICCTGVDCS